MIVTAPSPRVVPLPGQESVWEYPRPPRLEPVVERIRVEFGGYVVADSTAAYRVLETSHPPVIYVPPADVCGEYCVAAAGQSFCEFKGVAHYWTLETDAARSPKAAWSYPEPTAPFLPIRDFLAFYPSRVEQCWIDDERVEPQEGDFYGGWITSRIVGPFKGAPGTRGW